MPPCRGTDLPTFVEAFLDDPHFVCIAPMSPADTIRRGHNFNRGFEFKVAHKVEAITPTQNPSGGPPRRHTVELFQDCIGHPVLFENYPSVIRGLGLGQPKFLNDLCEVTGCGVLFDISNADIASQNTGLDLNAWIPVIGRSQHFHIGGYAETSFQPSFIVDTHDTNLSESSLNFTVSYVRPYASVSSVVVERDVNLDVEAWEIDIDKVRGSLSEQ